VPVWQLAESWPLAERPRPRRTGLSWTENGVPHAAHHMHLLTVADDHIVGDTVMCGGRWPASLLAEMEAADA
jgi:hypothetical protein